MQEIVEQRPRLFLYGADMFAPRCAFPSTFFFLMVVAILPQESVAQPAPSDPQPPSQAATDAAEPEEIEQPRPAFYVHAEPDRESRTYYEGERMSVRVKSEVDAYLYVVYKQADGQTYVVFPNSAQRDNHVPAKEQIELPGKDDTFRWTVGAPFGEELLKVIASQERLAEFETPEIRQQRFAPVTGKLLREVAGRLARDTERDEWSETTLKISTCAGPNPNSPYSGKRYVLLIGVWEQWITKPMETVLKQASVANLYMGPVYDVAIMQRCLQARGEIDEILTLIEPDAPPTKEAIQQAITQKLPSLAKPGDTVLIYYSGHGGQRRDPNEKDGYCESLVPCDFIDIWGLLALRKLDQSGDQTLDMQQKTLLARAEEWLRQEGLVFDPAGTAWQQMSEQAQNDLYQKVNDLLCQRSGISDDEFGHWVQALDGRRVAVMLDACFSGGFADEPGDGAGQRGGEIPLEKALHQTITPAARPLRFDFLHSQLGRLKDLGQGNTAMLAASRAGQTSQQGSLFPEQAAAYAWRAELIKELGHRDKPTAADQMGAFTFFLANTLLEQPGGVDVRQAGTACERQLSEYYRWLSAKTQRSQKGHTPVFFDHSRPPILLKP
ncbi:MAG TPA: DUF4384 domain-containing protein [Pirellulales bacterium]|nr:DUF4384 domain-containing protein [Pirellulales bacterium]